MKLVIGVQFRIIVAHMAFNREHFLREGFSTTSTFLFSGALLFARPLRRVIMPHICDLLFAGYCQKCFGVGICNCQEGPGCAARLLAALFPTLQCAHRYAE